jgi:4-amino-4-deoxy-L-arabinose transferase-like glycosyltransferase
MTWTRLVVVAGVALALRLLCAAWSWSGWHVLAQDALSTVYFEQGYALAEGEGYVRVTKSGSQPELLHPPGMPLVVAAVRLTTGGPADLPVQLLGALLDSAAAALLAWIISAALGGGAGTSAGLAYAAWPPAIWAAAAERSPEGLMPIFVLGALACVFQAGQRGGSRSLAWGAGAGVLVGCGSYLRPDYLLLPLALCAGQWAWRRRPFSAVATASVAQAVALLLLLPWAWRNHDISGRWIFTSTSVGATLISGLGEFRNPWGFGYTDGDRAREAAAQGFASPWTPEADLYFRRLFREAVAEHPGAYGMAVLRRIPLAIAAPQSFGFDNPSKTHTFSEERQRSGADRLDVIRERPLYVLAAYWDVILVAGLNALGALACASILVRERRRGLVLLLVSPHLYGIGAHLLTHLEPRFILPSAFVLTIGVGWMVASRWSGVARPAEPASAGGGP